MPDSVSAERVIAAAPEAIFEYLADPAKHREIDGSGTVVEAKGATQRLVLGSTFGMSMKMGLPYSTTNTVVELEEGRRIAWRTAPKGALSALLGGRVWRYELDPVEGGTRVRETWDISSEGVLSKPFVKLAAGKTQKNLEATLARIEQLVTA